MDKIDTTAVIVGLLTAPLVAFLNQYVFDDWAFFITLLVLVSADTALGFYKSWRLGQVSSTSFARVFNKLLVYFALLIAAHAAAHLKIHGKPDVLLTWVDSVIYAAIVIRELLSIVEKAGALGVALPAWLLRRLRDFNETGKPT